MALREEFESSGNWLFRWRSYLPLIILGIVLLSLGEYNIPGGNEKFIKLWDAFCLVVGFSGLGIRMFTIGLIPRGTSGRNVNSQVAESLNKTGIYSVVRNPLYLGNFFMGLGIALFPFQWWLTIIYILIFWLYYERIMFAEEAFLREKFGDEYLEWARVTPAFIPKGAKYYIKSDLTFSVKNILKREYNGFFALIVIMFVLRIVRDIIVSNRIDFSFAWTALLCTGFIIWMTLRLLRKHTRLFYVEGR